MINETGRIHVGVVGLGFGAEFVPIYQDHPGVREVSIVDADPGRLVTVGDRFGVTRRHSDLADLLADEDVDAVHLLTPVSLHAKQAIAVMESGKHCACAVPMATSLEDLDAVLATQRATGKQYMMMETTVFSREFFYVRDLLDAGEFGDLTFYRGFHMQDLDGFPAYWQAYPPMHYVTHALSPVLALTGTTVESVQCQGSGRLTADRLGAYGNPFPLEVGLFALRDHDMVADITMAFFQTARPFNEGFSLYGSKIGIEWPLVDGDPMRRFEFEEVPPGGRGRPVSVRPVEPPNRADLLPEQIAGFTYPDYVVDRPGLEPTSVGDGHGGSHPHLVHEFVSSLLEGRLPAVDARTAAAWTAPGICAHDSALRGGERQFVPDFHN